MGISFKTKKTHETMDLIVLSKLLVTGKIDGTTPLVVLFELMVDCGFKPEIDKLNDTSIDIVEKDNSVIHITKGDRYHLSAIRAVETYTPRIVRFPPKEEDIHQAKKLIKDRNSSIDVERFLFTLKCAQNGLLCNNSILTPAIMYGLIKRNTEYKSFNKNSTIDEIKCVFEYYEQYFDKTLIYFRKDFASFLNCKQITTEAINEEFLNVRDMGSNYEITKNNLSLIAYMLYEKRIDIIDSNLQDVLMNMNINADPRRKMYLLRYHFNPILGPEIYSADDKVSLCRLNGLDEFLTPQEMHSELSIIYLTEKTFYSVNEHYQKIEGNTIMGDEMESCHITDIIFYGIKAESLVTMCLSDLENSFRITHSFKNPYSESNERFSLASIKKLERLPISSSLHKVITKIMNDTDTVSERIESFKNYIEANSEQKELSHTFFKEFMDLGFYMRGWNGKGAYPIAETAVLNQDDVDLRVCTQWEKISSLIEEKELKNRLLQLPLMCWSEERGYSISDIEGRSSISDIPEVVFSPNREYNINSCIRMTSNYVCRSSLFYLTRVCGDHPLFNIADMHIIA